MSDVPNEPDTGTDDDLDLGVDEVEAGQRAQADAWVEQHDPTGLDLASMIARAARGGPPRRRKNRSVPPPADPTLSGAGPDARDPASVKVLLDRYLAQHGFTAEMNVHVVLGRWDDIVGEDVAAHAQPESYTDGVLLVRCVSTAWATQIRQLAPLLVAKLNTELGDATVTRVDVRGPDAPSWKKGRRSVPGQGPRDTYG